MTHVLTKLDLSHLHGFPFKRSLTFESSHLQQEGHIYSLYDLHNQQQKEGLSYANEQVCVKLSGHFMVSRRNFLLPVCRLNVLQITCVWMRYKRHPQWKPFSVDSQDGAQQSEEAQLIEAPWHTCPGLQFYQCTVLRGSIHWQRYQEGL